MSFKFHQKFAWDLYSKKLCKAILKPHNAGVITHKEADLCEMRLVTGKSGRYRDGNVAKIYLLVDEDDGQIADCKFQMFGDSALAGALQTLCGLVLRKNYDQANHMSADFIDSQLRDRADIAAFPKSAYTHLNLALSAMSNAVEKCQDIPFASNYVPPTPFQEDDGGEPQYPNFLEYSLEQQMSLLEDVIAKDVRPYVELDSGDVKITKIDNYQLTVTYEGSCTSCYSATGATLNAIQSILKSKVNRNIEVIPDLSTLTFA
ncbi:MAG: NifU family protein [Rhabdochlamydiaceae bacterium]|nr:NifU family protein [Candidatus Amphrikana amoebophyrae]